MSIHPVNADGALSTAQAVTALFVPGDRPERFAKAKASGASIVIIDLEDAVPEPAKADALAATLEALTPASDADGPRIRALVRVNPQGSPLYDTEMAALLSLAKSRGHGLLGFLVPKAEDPDLMNRLADDMPVGLALVPLVESAAGLVNALELARGRRVTRLAFGAIDFALDIDAAEDDGYVAYARSQLVVASRAADVAAPLDSPTTEVKDTLTMANSARLARGFGFGGKLCIHPGQVAIIAEAFVPTTAEINWAHDVIAAEGRTTLVNGQMVDKPVTERAKRILMRTGAE